MVGRKAARSAGIAENGGREWINGATTEARRTECSVDPIVVHRLEGINSDIDSLTDSKENTIDSLRIYGNEVSRDDSHVVIHNGDSEVILLRGVDKAKTMTLSWAQIYASI